MEQSFTVAPGDFTAALTKPTADAPKDGLSDLQQTAVNAVWAATNTTVADQYDVSIASSDEGGWTVVRVAARKVA